MSKAMLKLTKSKAEAGTYYGLPGFEETPASSMKLLLSVTLINHVQIIMVLVMVSHNIYQVFVLSASRGRLWRGSRLLVTQLTLCRPRGEHCRVDGAWRLVKVLVLQCSFCCYPFCRVECEETETLKTG
jgi:hypothetical protein